MEYISEFEAFVQSILSEDLSQQGTGGIATRAKSVVNKTQTAPSSANTSVNGGVQMKHTNPQIKNSVTGKPDNKQNLDAYDDVILASALQQNDQNAIGTVLGKKMLNNPQYFQSPEFQKNPALVKWSQMPQNQQFISSLVLNPQTQQ